MRAVAARVLAMLALVGAVACTPSMATFSPAPSGWRSSLGRDHPLVGRVWDVRRRAFVSEDALLGALAAATFVGIGEQHDNADHHLIQARVIDALVSRHRAPGVVFEMLDREREGEVRRAVEAHPREPDAVATAADWAHSGWPAWSAYRPIFVAASAGGLPLFAGGIDRKGAMRLAMEGASAAPPELVRDYALDSDLPSAVEDSLRAEMRDAHCGLLPDSMLDGMVFVQRVRDATLADGLVRAGSRGGVLIAGNGHVRRDRGVPSLVARRKLGPMVAFGLIEVRTAQTQPGDYAQAFGATELPFDYVLFTPRASDEDHCAELRAKRR